MVLSLENSPLSWFGERADSNVASAVSPCLQSQHVLVLLLLESSQSPNDAALLTFEVGQLQVCLLTSSVWCAALLL